MLQKYIYFENQLNSSEYSALVSFPYFIVDLVRENPKNIV